jgi:hypothetical protein
MTNIKTDNPTGPKARGKRRQQPGIGRQPQRSPSTHGAWAPIRRALTQGSQAPAITVSGAREADALMAALKKAADANPWLLSLAAADPHRLLGAAGITLRGAARQRFDEQRRAEGQADRPEEFDKAVAPPARSATPGAGRSSLARQASVGTAAFPTKTVASVSLESAVDRIRALSQSAIVPMAADGSDVQPVVDPVEPGFSHAANLNYQGMMGAWDAVIQLHGSFLKRQYDVLFAAQALAGAFGGSGDPNVIDFRFTFESWLFLFIRCDLVIDVIDETGEVVLDGSGLDEAGVRFRFTATSYSRLLPDQDWDQTDQFTGTFTRYGPLVKPGPVALAGETFRRTWAADLANGWTTFALDDGPDGGREQLLDAAVNAYFTAELPLLPVTPTFPVNKPLFSYPTSAAFATAVAPDLNAVSLCFHEDAETLIPILPFRHYILDHGRNLAVGISIAALERDVVDGLNLPVSDSGVTVETVTITGDYGRLHIRSEGKGPLGIKFSHTADILMSLENGQLVADVDKSTLNLPWWLWVLNGLLFVPLFGGPGGLIPLAITNMIGSTIIGNQLEGLIDLSTLQDAVGVDTGVDGVTTRIDRVEINPFGVFLKGDVEIDATRLL